MELNTIDEERLTLKHHFDERSSDVDRRLALTIPKQKVQAFINVYFDIVAHFGTHSKAEKIIGLSNTVLSNMRNDSVLSVRSARTLLDAHAKYVPKAPPRPNVVRKNPIANVTYEQAPQPSLQETPVMSKKTPTPKTKAKTKTVDTRPQSWTKTELKLLMNTRLSRPEIAERLGRTPNVCAKRRYYEMNKPKMKARSAAQWDAKKSLVTKKKMTKIGPAVVKPKIEAATPVVPVYTYEGKHNIATFNKLGWFTRTLLGVRAA